MVAGPGPAQPRGRSRSRLTRPQRVWLIVGLALAAFMIADALYLLANRLAGLLGLRVFAPDDTSLPVILQVAILSHTGVGLLMAAVLIVFAAWHLPRVWIRRRRRSVVSGAGVVVIGLTLAVSGLFIMTEAHSRDNAWIWWTHVFCGAAVVALFMSHRWVSTAHPTPRAVRGVGAGLAVLFAAFLVAHGVTRRETALVREARLANSADAIPAGSATRDRAEYLRARFVPQGFVPPESPFFPSAATTTTGRQLSPLSITRGESVAPDQVRADLDTFGFLTRTPAGAQQCARCHADIVSQWITSAHRFASFNNPFYEATINDIRTHSLATSHWLEDHLAVFDIPTDRAGMAKSKWCGGCHDPAIMLSGGMNDPIDRASVEAQAGLACLACHAIDRIHNYTGNGNYNIADEQRDPYLFSEAMQGLAAFLHDTAVKARPAVHKAQMLKPMFRTPEFCAACHKVSLDVPVNNYRWVRGQDEYDAWHDSGVAHNAARTFYLPPEPKRCQDCHMPLEPAVLGDVSAHGGMVRSHRFLAVNTALPFVRGDEDTIRRIERFLEGKLSVDVFALRHGRDEPLYALDRTIPPLVAGKAVQFEIVVRNRGVGHTFPGGTNDSNEGWLEITLLDDRGEVIASSGDIRPDGQVDPAAHFYRAVILDHDGHPVLRRNAQDIHVVAYANAIGPGTADVARYRVQIPDDLAGRAVTLRARLLWRKFHRAYTEFAYHTNPEGFRRFDGVPDLPVTELARDEVTLSVVTPVDPAATTATVALADDWMRFNDYGIGLLLDGDTRGAAEAFARVAELAPERLDGPRNLARVAIRDGNLAEAYGYLRECEEVAPGDPQTAFFWGIALQEDGRYEEAAAAYRRTLQRFGDDRVTWRNLGRTLYLDGRYEDALAAFGEVLRIDPEDRTAHYHRMLILKATDQLELAAAAEEAYEKYRIDESAQQLTLEHRRRNPHDNIESQPIHVHGLMPRGMDSKRLSFGPAPATGQGEAE